MAVATKGSAVVTLPTDTQLKVVREFDAPARLVFRAYTEPELVKRWWHANRGTVTTAEIDLRVGGKWRFHMRKDDGDQMGLYGEYREIGPPQRLVNTELFEDPYFEEMGAGTINTMILAEEAGTTTMKVTSLYKSKEARDTALATGMESGASESLDRLDDLLKTLVA